MLKYLNNKRAQAVMGEYVLVIFLVIASMVAMTIFFKRAVQARIHDARDYMVGEVRERTRAVFDGNLYKEYEPYYGNTDAIVVRDSAQTSKLWGGGSSGVYRKDVNEAIQVRVLSETAPPRDFDLTTPKN